MDAKLLLALGAIVLLFGPKEQPQVVAELRRLEKLVEEPQTKQEVGSEKDKASLRNLM